MFAKYLKYPTAIILYVVFSIASAAAGLLGLLVGAIKRDPKYTANVMHSMDMTLAAIFGWDGRKTVSKECGLELLSGNPSTFCKCTCKVLDHTLAHDHCIDEGKK